MPPCRLVLSLAAGLAAAAPAQTLPPPTTGDLLVSSWGNDRLLRLDPTGVEIAAYAPPSLTRPRGIARAPDGSLFVASENRDEIVVLDRNLRELRRFATAPVRGPTGIAFTAQGTLLVPGFASSDIGEFRFDGTFVRGHTAPDLVGANCVALRGDGGFYVASAGNGKVVQFDSTGAYVRSFTGFGLSSPMGIALWGSELFVAGGASNNIVVFDLSGTPLRELRHAYIAAPQGVAFDRDGVMAVPSFSVHVVGWFRRDGAMVRVVRPPSSSVPRSAAFLPGVAIDAVGQPVLGQPFPFAVRCPHEPGGWYLAALSLATSPGVMLPDRRTLPLAPDALFFTSLTAGPPAFTGFVGRLDAQGDAALSLWLPDLPPLRGLTVYAAALTFAYGGPTRMRQVSSAVAWRL